MELEDKIIQKVKESIGEFITDDELKELVKEGIQKAFFEQRKVQERTWNSDEKIIPSLFVEIIQNLLKEDVTEKIKEWLKEHPEEVNKTIQETLEKGIYEMMINHFRSQTSWPIQQLADNLKSKGLI